MDPDVIKAILVGGAYFLVQSFVEGFGAGVKSGVEKRVSGLIAGRRRKTSKKQKSWFQKMVLFLVVTAIAYGIIKFWPLLFLLI